MVRCCCDCDEGKAKVTHSWGRARGLCAHLRPLIAFTPSTHSIAVCTSVQEEAVVVPYAEEEEGAQEVVAATAGSASAAVYYGQVGDGRASLWSAVCAHRRMMPGRSFVG